MSQFKYTRQWLNHSRLVTGYAVEHEAAYLGIVHRNTDGFWYATGSNHARQTREQASEDLVRRRVHEKDQYATYLWQAQQLSPGGQSFLIGYLLKDLTDDQRYDAIEAAREYEKQQH